MFKFLYFNNICMYSGVINRTQCFYQIVQNVRYKHPTYCKSFHCSPKHAFKIRNTRNSIEKATLDPLKINTDVQNNVLLYKYENKWNLTGMRIFMLGWAFCSTLIAYYSFDLSFITLWSQNLTWKSYMKAIGFRPFYFLYGIISGPFLLLVMNFSIRRYIRYIILHKGGRDVTVITDHLFKGKASLTVPVNQVQTTMRRSEMKHHLPLKIQNQNFYYLLEREGTILNETLFDNTVGTAKNWSKTSK